MVRPARPVPRRTPRRRETPRKPPTSVAPSLESSPPPSAASSRAGITAGGRLPSGADPRPSPARRPPPPPPPCGRHRLPLREQGRTGPGAVLTGCPRTVGGRVVRAGGARSTEHSRPPRPPGASSSARPSPRRRSHRGPWRPWWWTHRPAPGAALSEPVEHDSRAASGAAGRPAGQPGVRPRSRGSAARRFGAESDGARRRRSEPLGAGVRVMTGTALCTDGEPRPEPEAFIAADVEEAERVLTYRMREGPRRGPAGRPDSRIDRGGRSALKRQAQLPDGRHRLAYLAAA